MCTITGNNIFGQWNAKDLIVSKFREVSFQKTEDSIIPEDLKIIEINWFYNIYRTKDNFYISGMWNSKEKQFIKINIPKECNKSNGHNDNYLITGNDYKLFLVEKDIVKLWIITLDDYSVNEINFNEVPIIESPKRNKVDFTMRKVKATNENLICLTDNGVVYSGMLPSLVKTDHCLGTICDIDCGLEHFMLLTNAGRVYTWGNGRRLQLGHGDLNNIEIPSEIEALAGIKIVKISAGGWHSAALSEFGDLYVWGWNDMGQLGISNKDVQKSDSDSQALPTLVDIYNSNGEVIDLNVRDVACGSRHTSLILEDNSVWTAGNNKYGQLGFDPTANPTVYCFRKAYECTNNSKLLCGPWTTVLENNE